MIPFGINRDLAPNLENRFLAAETLLNWEHPIKFLIVWLTIGFLTSGARSQIEALQKRMDEKGKTLRNELEKLLTISGSIQSDGDKDILFLDWKADSLTNQVRQFYEKWPYHQNAPVEDLKTRLLNLEKDWKNWMIPVTLYQKRTMDASGYKIQSMGI